ncbi:GtrA family protein [Solirubrobacter soli]|uniref:GtrA family protein n=1 Tax=Solirubrobacter soli TaxID=363832 RepID=UPI000424D28F|nr:GtrA family protein [Solirubrobacter soli]
MARFVRFCLVGVLNTVVTLGVYAVALRLAVPYLPAGALAYGLGAVNGFVLNRAWTFRVRGHPMRYATVVGIGLALNALLLRCAVGMNVPRGLAEVAVAAPVTLVTFALSRRWAFASDVTSRKPQAGLGRARRFERPRAARVRHDRPAADSGGGH